MHLRRSESEMSDNGPYTKKKVISAFAAAASGANILLATGPFVLPLGYCKMGYILSPILMLFSMIFGYICFQFVLEAMSISAAMRAKDTYVQIIDSEVDSDDGESEPKEKQSFTKYWRNPFSNDNRKNTVRSKETDPSSQKEIAKGKFLDEAPSRTDISESSPFYISEKIEVSQLAQDHQGKPLKIIFLIIIFLYMYGGMIYKYVLGSRSLAEAISYNRFDDREKYKDQWPWLYYVCVSVFGGLCVIISLGNIEDSKLVQIIFSILRFVLCGLLIGASIYVIAKYGDRTAYMSAFDFSYFYLAFSTIIFTFIVHHSIPGFISPVREQLKARRYFCLGFFFTLIVLVIESTLACIAFEGYSCKNQYPIGLSDLYNINFLGLPGVGEIANYYPVFNVVAVPIMCITLRNNLMLMFSKSGTDLSATRCTRIIWTICLSIPCFVVAYLQVSTVDIIDVTGGVFGVFILAIIPTILVHYARKHDIEKKLGHSNPLKSNFQSKIWIYAILIIAPLMIVANLYFYIYQKIHKKDEFCK